MSKNTLLLRIAQWIFTIALFIVTAVFFRNIPTRSESYAPIDVHGVATHRVSGRNISVRVTAVYSTQVVRWEKYTGGAEITDGRWLVVNMACTSLEKAESFSVELRADDKIVTSEINSAEKCGPPDISQEYALVFDVPRTSHQFTLLLKSSLGGLGDFSGMTNEGLPVDSRLVIDIPPSMVIERDSVDIPKAGGRI